MKSGRAGPNIFDHLEINVYNEKHPFSDLCQTIVKGNNMLHVKVFDEGAKDEVLKALTRSDFDLTCSVEGNDIKVKLGTSKKEHIDIALKKIKAIFDTFKKDQKEARFEVQQI